MNLILLGFKGSGKSFWGRRLSSVLQCPFLDTDLLVEAHYGKAVRDIVLQEGETRFRQLESEILHRVNPTQPTVIATGGGIVIDPRNRELLQRLGQCVHLKVDKTILENRLFTQKHLPTFIDPVDPKASFETIYEKRISLYESIQDHCLEVSTQTETAILEQLIHIMRDLIHGK